MPTREDMIEALRTEVIPALRDIGFKGSFPHFRRPQAARIDLLTFQFDKWGGGFVVEVATCPATGTTLPWGKQVGPRKVTAHDVGAKNRPRLGPAGVLEGHDDHWFRYDGAVGVIEVARQVVAAIPGAVAWWDSK
jgi:hypothetical protein